MSAFSWDKEEEKTDTFEIPIVIRGQRVTEKRKLSRSCSTKLDPKLIPQAHGTPSTPRSRTSSTVKSLPQSLDDCFEALEMFLTCGKEERKLTKRNSLVKNIASLPKTLSSGKIKQENSPNGISFDEFELASKSSSLIFGMEELIQIVYSYFIGNNVTSDRFSKSYKKITQRISLLLDIFSIHSFNVPTKELIGNVQAMIEQSKISGTANIVTVELLTNERPSVISNIITTLKNKVQEDLVRVRSFGLQILGAVGSKNTLLFVSIVYGLLSTVSSVLDNIETIKELSILQSTNEKNRNLSDSKLQLREDNDNISIYEEDYSVTYPEGTKTLNSIIMTLTSTEKYTSDFMKSFSMTYRSYTTPWTFLQKLKERFNDIPADVPDAAKSQIQLRVCVVLKYWIETKIMDFDTQLLRELKQFLKDSIATLNAEMASRLLSTLKQTVEVYHKKFEHKMLRAFTPSLVQLYYTNAVTQISLLNDFSPVTIAQQLSLVDLEVFHNLEVVGFLNQSWSKPALQHRALSLVYFIERLNRYSYWVATMLLVQPTVYERTNVLSKILRVADVLLETSQNFHAIAGIVAGLNIAPIIRLKFTFNLLPKKDKIILDKINAFMDPTSSYSNYRKSLLTRSLPLIPYLGIYLTDLTFIDEGNSDFIDGYINQAKQDMIYDTIRDILVYKQSKYDIEPNILLQHFFRALPALDAEDLYAISINLEPRGACASDIA